MKCVLVIPTYNGGDVWKTTAENIKKYADENVNVQIIDSGSSDGTLELAQSVGFNIQSIPAKDFNHGGTRNLAAEIHSENCDVIIFLTQDAIPEPGFIEKILVAFEDSMVACVYGRQLPHKDATSIAEHARRFNYTENSYTASLENINDMGLKTVFMSNSFSAYRVSIFKSLGGFPSNTILCEDMYFAAKAVLAGYKNAYAAEAIVRHSHNYSPVQEFKRYFDIGVFHANESWIRDKFGGAGGEGMKFIFSELKFLLKNNPSNILLACLNNFMKILGYKLGQKYRKLPRGLIHIFSMHRNYWL